MNDKSSNRHASTARTEEGLVIIIQLLLGEARDRLPDIDWSRLSITWLDYTDLLSTDILRDVEYVLRASSPASVLIVTVNGGAEAGLPRRLPELRDNLGELVSQTLTDDDMKGWGPAREQRRILQDRANSVVRAAHSGEFQQLFKFEYADGAKMLTSLVRLIELETMLKVCASFDARHLRNSE